MAVARLSMRWILETLGAFPQGVARRELLDHFARILVSERATPGAKGRLARRLYGQLEKLGRKDLVLQAGGRVALLPAQGKARAQASPPLPRPLLTPPLRRLLFLALLAEDRPEEDPGASRLQQARQAFIDAATEALWTAPQIARELGIPPGQVHPAPAPRPGAPPRPWHVYVIRCADGTLYTGISTDVEARFEQHRAGKGAKYTRGRGALAVIHQELAGTSSAATRREAAIKRLTRSQKLALASPAPPATSP